ncbi:MAG: hypothetical protein Ta2F_09760 [Termitinemataceae bacterium]|nr:MAG: hypothetical protein Ta2F_09760 [Termitinemataceae bacterium]
MIFLEKMNVLAITGSPRSESVSKKMLEKFLLELECDSEADLNVTIIDSYKTAAKPCIHCGTCKKKFDCIYDDLDLFHKALKDADMLIIATPCYALSFPSPLKAIVDRLQMYFEAKFSLGMLPYPIKKPKTGILLASCGSNDTRGFDIMEQQLRLVFRAINTELSKTFFTVNTDKKE